MDEALTPEVLRLARLILASGLHPEATPAGDRTEPYHVPEAAEILGIHRATLYREIQRGHCDAFRVGIGRGAIRISVAAFAKYQHRIKAAAATHPPAPRLQVVTEVRGHGPERVA